MVPQVNLVLWVREANLETWASLDLRVTQACQAYQED